MASAAAARDAQICAPELNRTKGFLGTAPAEMTSVAETLAPHSVAWVKSLSDAELFPLGERALQDIADDILVLDEIRTRFRAKGSILGYLNWREFISQNSRYSVRTIQNRLAEKNGKDASKVNHNTGNQHTREPAPDHQPKVTPSEPVSDSSEPYHPNLNGKSFVDADPLGLRESVSSLEGLPKRWHKYEREDPNGCTLGNLRARINEIAKHFEDPFAFLGLTRTHKVPTGATQAEAMKTRQTLDIPAQWEDSDGKRRGTTNVQYTNGQLLNKLILAVENGDTSASPAPVAPEAPRTGFNPAGTRGHQDKPEVNLAISRLVTIANQNPNTDFCRTMLAALDQCDTPEIASHLVVNLDIAIRRLQQYHAQFKEKAND